MITIENLTKNFGDVTALNGLTLTVRDFPFGLIGPNGAGKTTLIKILTGLIKKYKGNVSILGHNIRTDYSYIKKLIGIAHENPKFPAVRAIKFLEFVAKLRGIPKKDALNEAKKMLKKVGLNNTGNLNLDGFSAGMVRRFSIAQAIIGEPKIVILDEPTSNLDPSGRIMLKELINKKRKEIAFFISTHALLELQDIFSSVAFIRNGEILEEMSAATLSSGTIIYKVHTNQPEKLILQFKNRKNVIEVKIVSNTEVLFTVADSKYFLKDLMSIAEKEKIDIFDISKQSKTLYDIYKEVVGI